MISFKASNCKIHSPVEDFFVKYSKLAFVQ